MKTTFDRLEKTRNALRLNQGEMCKELGIGRTMYHYLKTGERKLSVKAARRLEYLESVVERGKEGNARIEGAAAATVDNAGFEKMIGLEHRIDELTRELKAIRARIDKVLDGG